MKKYSDDYIIMGFNALKRATLKAFEKARKNNLKIPIWRNGTIEYIIPEIDSEQINTPEHLPIKN